MPAPSTPTKSKPGTAKNHSPPSRVPSKNAIIPLNSPLESMLRLAIDKVEADAKTIIADRMRIVAKALAAGQPAPWNLTRDELMTTATSVRRLLNKARGGLLDGRRMRVAAAIRDIRVELARIDCATFTELVIKTETGRKPVRLTEMHREWHRMADESDNVIILAHINSGKSSMFVLPRVLWELGRDPEKRIIIVSETTQKAKKIARPMSAAIRYSADLRVVFPRLRPTVRDGEPWTTTEMTVDRPNFSKDGSITIVSALNPVCQGSRVDLVFFDDILTRRTARKPEQQAELRQKLQAEVMGRFSTDTSRLIAVNTAWKSGDYLNHLNSTLKNVASKRYGVYDESGKIRCPWITQKWIDARVDGLGPTETKRQLYVQDQEDENSKFDEKWFTDAKALGDGLPLIHSFTEEDLAKLYAQNYVLSIGIDFAASEKKRVGAKTAFTVMLSYPDGDYQLLNIEAGQWGLPTIRDKIIAYFHRYKCPIFVETNGIQKWALQLLQEIGDIPVYPFNTGHNKTDPAFGVGALEILFAARKFVIPSKDGRALGQIEELINDLRAFRPNTHTGDVLMSCWIAKEGARQLREQGYGVSGAVSV